MITFLLKLMDSIKSMKCRAKQMEILENSAPYKGFFYFFIPGSIKCRPWVPDTKTVIWPHIVNIELNVTQNYYVTLSLLQTWKSFELLEQTNSVFPLEQSAHGLINNCNKLNHNCLSLHKVCAGLISCNMNKCNEQKTGTKMLQGNSPTVTTPKTLRSML